MASPSGDVYVPDWRGGLTIIRADGSQETWLARSGDLKLRPNAIAPTPDGAFLIANLGDEGGVWRLTSGGELTPFLTEFEGRALPPCNFVTVEPSGRTWISISTRRQPRQLAWRQDVADGFIMVVDERGPRIAANHLHYTNEVRPHPDGEWLYAIETFGRRISRFPIGSGGDPGARETVVEFGFGCFPDGLAFDREGGIWVTSLVSNRVLRVTPEGRIETVIEDFDPENCARVEQAFATGAMAAEHLGPIPGIRLQQVTSIAFGGPDLRTAFLGSLHASCLYRFQSPIAGAPPAHWSFDLP